MVQNGSFTHLKTKILTSKIKFLENDFNWTFPVHYSWKCVIIKFLPVKTARGHWIPLPCFSQEKVVFLYGTSVTGLWSYMAIHGHNLLNPKYGHDGYQWKEHNKTNTPVKKSSDLDVWLKSYNQNKHFDNFFGEKNGLFKKKQTQKGPKITKRSVKRT